MGVQGRMTMAMRDSSNYMANMGGQQREGVQEQQTVGGGVQHQIPEGEGSGGAPDLQQNKQPRVRTARKLLLSFRQS